MDSALKLPSGVTHGDEASLHDSGVKQKKTGFFFFFLVYSHRKILLGYTYDLYIVGDEMV